MFERRNRFCVLQPPFEPRSPSPRHRSEPSCLVTQVVLTCFVSEPAAPPSSRLRFFTADLLRGVCSDSPSDSDSVSGSVSKLQSTSEFSVVSLGAPQAAVTCQRVGLFLAHKHTSFSFCLTCVTVEFVRVMTASTVLIRVATYLHSLHQ